MMTTSKKVSSSYFTIGHALLLAAVFSGCGPGADASGDGAFVVTANDGGVIDGKVSSDTPPNRAKGGIASSLACTSNEQCESGSCADGVCCDTACDGSCVSCALTGKVGTCSPVIDTQDDTCGGDSTCDGAGTCLNALGHACTAPRDCASGNCVDGVCCTSSACGTCQSCSVEGSVGACAPVAKFSDDPDTCLGANTCNGLGACQLKNGGACAVASQCVSQQCVDGVCCEQSCSGTCFACNQPGSEGTCKPLDGAEDHAALATCEGTRVCSAPGGAAPACKLKDGQPCGADDQCFGGYCLTAYFDGDGDGYGSATTLRLCGRTPPAGYVARAGDCCDQDSAAHPGAVVGAPHLDACGSYDWNCNGTVELPPGAIPNSVCGCANPIGKFGNLCVSCK